VTWLRKNWRWLLALGVAAIAIPLLILLWMSRKNQEAQKLKAQLAMMQAQAKIAGIEADMVARAEELRINKEAAKAVRTEILEIEKKVVATTKEIKDMSDDDVHAEFERLGL